MKHLFRKSWLLISFAGLMLLCVGGSQARAQGDEQVSGKVALKYDEFEAAYGCDHGARLDNFAIELLNNPQVVGYVICYGPEGEGNGSGAFRCKLTEDYMVQARGLSPERIKTVYSGRYKDLKMSAVEFWIVPPGAEPPEAEKYENPAATFTGKFEERLAWDNAGFDESTGPSIGDVSLAAFADLLRQQPETVAYIVAYSTADSAPGAWRRAAKEIAGNLEADYKIAADRVKILCGGYNAKADSERGASAEVHLWIVPKDSPPPVAEETAPEPKPEVAVKVGQFDDQSLEDAAYARRVFQGFADVLNKDKQMQACVIIRPLSKTAEQEAQDKKWGIARADLHALAEAWRNDLEKKYGISRDRLFVVTVEASEYSSGIVETWLVPAGAQLPDPNAFEAEQVPSEEEMIETGNDPQE